jgi:F0F1-type ATP synthase membrane subunit b/b'
MSLTTKHTKATKVSDIDIFKLLNFVLFVTFVVKFAFSSLVAALPRWELRGKR